MGELEFLQQTEFSGQRERSIGSQTSSVLLLTKQLRFLQERKRQKKKESWVAECKEDSSLI